MTRNRSIFLVGIFFLIVIFFGIVFWRMFSRSDDDNFEKIKKEAKNNLAKNSMTSTGVSAQTASRDSGDSKKEVLSNSTPVADVAQEPQEKKTEDEKASWEVFLDEKSRFEFRYPAEVKVVPSGDLFRILQEGKTWKFRIYANKNRSDLGSWYAEEFSEKERKNCTLTDSTLKVSSYEMKYANPNSGETKCAKAGHFSISTDKKMVMRIELGEETIENANEILATFKFKE